MTQTNTTTGWNPTAGSNYYNHSQTYNESESRGPLETTAVPYREQRAEYFRTHYDVMTGIRIAGTLGGFFVLVLLTLLYKSKCKKSSRVGTPSAAAAALPPPLPPSPPMDCPRRQPLFRPSDGPSPLLLLTSPPPSSASSSSSSSGRSFLPPRGRKRRRTSGPIDIHVIQPTPRPRPGRPFSLASPGLGLKYVDDTSSENLPAAAGAEEDGSIGSDSVFTFYSRKASLEEEEPAAVCRMTLTQAQVHYPAHRDSFCSSELESVSDYLESRRRRSSSTQTNLSDLRQAEGPSSSSLLVGPTGPYRPHSTHLIPTQSSACVRISVSPGGYKAYSLQVEDDGP